MTDEFQPLIPDFDPGEPGAALGKGMAWPPREDPTTGDFKRAEGEESISSCILNLITTVYEEIPLLELMGTRIERLLFSNDLDGLLELFRLEVGEALKRHEKRVFYLGTTFEVSGTDRNTLSVKARIRYRVRATGQPDTLVFPFSLNGTPEGV